MVCLPCTEHLEAPLGLLNSGLSGGPSLGDSKELRGQPPGLYCLRQSQTLGMCSVIHVPPDSQAGTRGMKD